MRKNPTLGFLRTQKSDGGRVICVRKLRARNWRMRRNWRTPITPADLAYGQIRPNSDSPSEPSLAKSGAIRSDGRKNPSAYYALSVISDLDPPTGGERT